MSDKPFGDISHDRDSRSLNLPTKTTIILPSLALAYRFVDLPRKLSSFFPTIKILKSGELHCMVFLVGPVYLVCLVCLVYAVCLVEEVYSVFLNIVN